jgi:hypothetical protein
MGTEVGEAPAARRANFVRQMCLSLNHRQATLEQSSFVLHDARVIMCNTLTRVREGWMDTRRVTSQCHLLSTKTQPSKVA